MVGQLPDLRETSKSSEMRHHNHRHQWNRKKQSSQNVVVYDKVSDVEES